MRACGLGVDIPNLKWRLLNPWVSILGGQAVHDFYRFDADADDLADEADDVFLVVGVVGVAGDAAGRRGDSVLFNLVLVDDPIQRAAVAEAVVEDFGRDFGERERVVDLELGLVFGEPHFLDVVGEGHALGFDPLERPGFELFVAEVEFILAYARATRIVCSTYFTPSGDSLSR